MDFLAVIPARYASTRFPGKPLVDINGKPMIRMVCERVSEVFEHVYVATDDDRIAEAVRGFGGNAVMTSARHRSGTDRSAEALEKISAKTGIVFDVVVNVQGDEPFVSREHLTIARSLFDDPSTRIGTLVKPFSEGEDIFNPNTPKVVVGKDGKALYFSRSPIPYIRGREMPDWGGSHVFYKHIGLYAYRADVLREISVLPAGILEQAESLEQLRWLENGYSIQAGVTHTESVAIDTPEDMERLLKIISGK